MWTVMKNANGTMHLAVSERKTIALKFDSDGGKHTLTGIKIVGRFPTDSRWEPETDKAIAEAVAKAASTSRPRVAEYVGAAAAEVM